MRRLPSAALLVALPALAGCASATAPDRAVRVIQADELAANRIYGQAAACGYTDVRKTVGAGASATVTIPLPVKADARYQCLVDAMTARGEDVEPASAEPTRREP